MGKTFDRPIVIQERDEITEQWTNKFKVHAFINKAKTDDEYLNGGAIQGKSNLVFEVRYFKRLEDIALNIQNYRIVYMGIPYDVKDYDDFNLLHKTVKILGVSY